MDGLFVLLKMAQDTLLDPAKRFAYDRFGPDIVNWGAEKTREDFLYAAVQRSMIPQYAGGLITILFLNFTWWSDWGRYVSSFSLPLEGKMLNVFSGGSLPLALS